MPENHRTPQEEEEEEEERLHRKTAGHINDNHKTIL